MLKIKPLSDADKIKIFKAIRFSFMTHDELLKLSMEPEFALGKEMILQGLSCKLNNYEHSGTTELLINLRPRDTQAMMAEPAEPIQMLAPNEGVNPRKTLTSIDLERKVQDGTMPRLGGSSQERIAKAQQMGKTMVDQNPYMKPTMPQGGRYQ